MSRPSDRSNYICSLMFHRFGAKYRVLEFDYQKMNTLEYVPFSKKWCSSLFNELFSKSGECLFSGVQVRSPMLEFDWRSMFNTMVFDPSLVKTTNNFSLYNIWPDKTNLRFMAVGPSYTLTRLTCDMTSISINMSVWWRISSTPCLKNRQAQRAVQKDVQSYCPEKTRCCSITILMNTVGKTISWVLPFLQRVQRF